MMLLLSLVVLAVPPTVTFTRVEPPLSPKGKLVVHAHAVPPLGWRRTSRGWEYLTPVSYRQAIRELEPKPWFVQVPFMNKPYAPLLISALMIGLVVYGPLLGRLSVRRARIQSTHFEHSF